MNRREKGYTIAVVVLILVLAIKSFVLDPVKLEDPSEIVFAGWVNEKLEEEYDGFLYDNGIVVHRLVSVKIKTENDEELYVGKVRRYLLGVLPMSEQYIKENVTVFEQ